MSRASITDCMNMKAGEVERIWKRMQDESIGGKIRAKVNPELLQKELDRFQEAFSRKIADNDSGLSGITKSEADIAREVIEETTFQLNRRHNQATHMAEVIQKQRGIIKTMATEGINNVTKVIDGILHLGPRNAANSLDGATRGWADTINRLLVKEYSALSESAKGLLKQENSALGDDVGELLYRTAKGDKSYGGMNKDVPMIAEGLTRVSGQSADALLSRGLDVHRMNDAAWYLRADNNMDRVTAMSKEDFVTKATALQDKMDWAEIKRVSGLDDIDPQEFFSTYYDRVVTGEYELVDEGLIGGMKMMLSAKQASKAGKSREKTRSIFFTGYDGWKAWSKEFGNGGNFVSHVVDMNSSTARTLGVLDTFGVQPSKTLDHMIGQMSESYGPNFGLKERNAFIDDVTSGYNFYAGRTVSRLQPTTRSYIRAIKNTTRSGMLGTDTMSALTTEGMGLMPRAQALLGNKTIADGFSSVKALAKWGGTESHLRSGVYVGDMMRELNNRWNDYVPTSFEKYSKRAAGAVDQLAGNNYVSDAHKFQLQTSFEYGMVDYIRTNFDGKIAEIMDQLTDTPFLSLIEQLGINRKDMAVMSKYIKNAGDDKRVNSIFDFDRVDISSSDAKVIAKYQAAKAAYQEMGSPGNNNRMSYLAAKRGQEGGIVGGLAQFIQFANYSSQVYNMAARHILMEKNGVAKAAGFTLWMTVMGALDVQLRQLVMFKEPKDVDGYLFMQGFARAGMGGVLGDTIISAGTNPRSGVLDKMIPALGPVKDLAGEGIRQGKRIAEGEFTGSDAAYGLTKVLGKMTPGGSIWWVKALYQRAILDNLKESIDPKRYREEVQHSKSADRRNNQKSYWKRGDLLPGQ